MEDNEIKALLDKLVATSDPAAARSAAIELRNVISSRLETLRQKSLKAQALDNASSKLLTTKQTPHSRRETNSLVLVLSLLKPKKMPSPADSPVPPNVVTMPQREPPLPARETTKNKPVGGYLMSRHDPTSTDRRWKEIAAEASREQDPEKLHELIDKLNEAFDNRKGPIRKALP